MDKCFSKTWKSILLMFILSVFTLGSIASANRCSNMRWNKVMKRGKIIVGVKADYKPWGYRDSNGNLIGMEIDMAKDVAAAMGVNLELVPVQSSNRMQFLQQGKIDLMIATMSDRVDRRKIVGITQPNYYTSGTNIMAPKALGLTSWEQLRGKPVCGKQGAFYNKIVAVYNKILAFYNNILVFYNKILAFYNKILALYNQMLAFYNQIVKYVWGPKYVCYMKNNVFYILNTHVFLYKNPHSYPRRGGMV